MNPSTKAPAAPAKKPARVLMTNPRGVVDLGPLVSFQTSPNMLTRQAPTRTPTDQRQRGAPPDSRGTRSAAFNASSYNAGDRTVEAVFSTGARVQRWFGFEELSLDAGAVDLERVGRNLCPFLNAHNQWDIGAALGRVVSARIENGQLVGIIQFAETDQGRLAEGMVSRGELTGVSIGYQVRTWQLSEILENDDEIWRATSWELLEVSLVSVPADPNAGVRSLSGTPSGTPAANGDTQEEEDMLTRNLGGGDAAVPPAVVVPPAATATRSEPVVAPAPAPAPAPTVEPAQRAATVPAADVRSAATNAGLDADATIELLARHADEPFTRDALMADIGRRFAERDTQATTRNVVPAQAGSNVTLARAMEDAVFHRMTPGSQLSDAGRNFRGMSLLRLAEEMLASSGINVRGMPATEIAERALHTGSDFPALMGSALNRRLRQAYEENQPSYQRWARRAPNAPNFKNIDVVQMSAMPDLLKVNEGGEFKYGTASDGKVTYSVATYGRIIGLSRQLIINDDLRALERVTTGFAGSASRLENRTVYSVLTANANMPDGNALFSAQHGNLAGAGAAIAAAPLGDSRKRMRLQKGLQDEELNLAPAFLIVPASQEQLAYQYTSTQFVPAKSTDVNEFRSGGRTALEPIVEAVLDANSTTAWYTAASTSQVDTVEYCYLEGAEGVQISSRMGFTVDGVEFKATLDFAAAAIDWRGLDKNPGA